MAGRERWGRSDRPVHQPRLGDSREQMLCRRQRLAEDVCAGNASAVEVAEAASGAARDGALATRDMAGRGGRAGYVNADLLKGVPDPGAFAVAEWMAAIVKGLQ